MERRDFVGAVLALFCGLALPVRESLWVRRSDILVWDDKTVPLWFSVNRAPLEVYDPAADLAAMRVREFSRPPLGPHFVVTTQELLEALSST